MNLLSLEILLLILFSLLHNIIIISAKRSPGLTWHRLQGQQTTLKPHDQKNKLPVCRTNVKKMKTDHYEYEYKKPAVKKKSLYGRGPLECIMGFYSCFMGRR